MLIIIIIRKNHLPLLPQCCQKYKIMALNKKLKNYKRVNILREIEIEKLNNNLPSSID